jgi:hypothetical protein
MGLYILAAHIFSLKMAPGRLFTTGHPGLTTNTGLALKNSVATRENAKPGVFTRKNLPDPEIFSLGAGRFETAHREIFYI